MEPFQSTNHQHKPKLHKKRLTQDQLNLLEISFNVDKKLRPERKAQLARELRLPPRQVAIWYQNKRARWKNQTLEVDYKTLEVRLDSVCDEKRRLEREVWMLRVELQKAHEMLYVMNLSAPPVVSSASTSCNEDGSSSLPAAEVNCSWEQSQGPQQMDELYACLMNADHQTGKLTN